MVLHVSCRADDGDKHLLAVNNLLFHQGRLYSAGDKGVIKVWTEDLQLLREFQAHKSSILRLTASKDTLFSCSDDGSIKSWDLESFKEKKAVLKDPKMEFWNVQYQNDALYTGDDQGNIKIFTNNGKYYGSIKVAEGVKDMMIQDNLIFTAKDNDIIVTDLKLEDGNVLFYVRTTLQGRGPFAITGERLAYATRDGRGIVLNRIDKDQTIHDLLTRNDAHDMIINAMEAVNWDNDPRYAMLFTGGWDRAVKFWEISDDSIKQIQTCQADMVVNSIVQGDTGSVYAGGSDGHIIRLDV